MDEPPTDLLIGQPGRMPRVDDLRALPQIRAEDQRLVLRRPDAVGQVRNQVLSRSLPVLLGLDQNSIQVERSMSVSGALNLPTCTRAFFRMR